MTNTLTDVQRDLIYRALGAITVLDAGFTDAEVLAALDIQFALRSPTPPTIPTPAAKTTTMTVKGHYLDTISENIAHPFSFNIETDRYHLAADMLATAFNTERDDGSPIEILAWVDDRNISFTKDDMLHLSGDVTFIFVAEDLARCHFVGRATYERRTPITKR